MKSCYRGMICSLVLVLLMAVAVRAGDVKPVFAFLPGSLENPSQAYAAKLFERYGNDYGFEVVVMDSAAGDPVQQAKNVNECIDAKVKVIAINPNDVVSILPGLKKAKEAGIIICLFSSDVPESSAAIRDIFCGVDDTVAGEVAAQTFIEQFPEGAKIVEIGGQAGHDAQLKRNQGFQQKISGSNIEVLASQNCSAWDAAETEKIMDDYIALFGSEIQGVFCHWDNGAAGVIRALEKAGMENVYIVGVDGCKTGFEQIMSGRQSVTIAQSFENIVRTTLKLAEQILQGQKVTAKNFIPFEAISAANIGDYEMPEW